MVFLLPEGLASMLMGAHWLGGGCRRLGWLWPFLKVRRPWRLPHWRTLPSMNDFSCMLFDSVLLTETSLQTRRSSHALPLLSQLSVTPKSFVVISTIFTASPSQATFFVHLREATPQPFTFYHEIAASQSPLQAPRWIPVLLQFPPHLLLLPPLQVLNLQFVRTAVNCKAH